MATDPLPVLRRTDASQLSQAVMFIAQALNLGGAAVNKNLGNLPPLNVVYPFRKLATTIAQLPAPEDAGAGAHALVTDSQVTLIDGLGTVLDGGGGPHSVPVYAAFNPDTGVYAWFIG